ncbi:MAG: hypothetical protein ACI8SK_001241, partial [Shewanella sp.]
LCLEHLCHIPGMEKCGVNILNRHATAHPIPRCDKFLYY